MPSVDVLRGLGGAAIKVSGEMATAPRTLAVDGDDSTVWGSAESDPSIGVAGEWWAADLGPTGPAFKPFGAYRIRQMGGYSPDVQNVATEVRIYATDDADVWAALPASGKISTDPAENGWHLVATYSGSLAFTDTGYVPISPPEGGRYVLFRAVSGGSLDWDVETLELWDYRGAARDVTRCDHGHLHGDRSHSTKREHAAIGVKYDNAISGSSATNVQGRLDEFDKPTAVVGHGAMGATETFNLGDGTDHEGTLDDDLAVTLAGATGGEAAWMMLVLTQDGTGGHSLDLPASVANAAEIEAAFDQAANAVNVLTVFTYDGGTIWYVFLASGSSPGGVVGPILIADDHSTPIVFADLLLTEEGDDFLYSDIGE